MTVDFPKPKMIETGFSESHSSASFLPRTKNPFGLFCSEANFARDLLYDKPIETVIPMN